jgi:sec-independent protein translocase protein TatB
MFELDWAKLVVIGVVALIAIGPKELPTVLRTVGQWMTKIRRMAAEFQGQFQEAMREAEMADLKKQVDEISNTARDLATVDPLQPTPGTSTGTASPAPTAPTTTDAAPSTEPAQSPPEPSQPAAPVEPVAASSAAPTDFAVPLPEPPPLVTEKDFAASSEAKPAAAEPEARNQRP